MIKFYATYVAIRRNCTSISIKSFSATTYDAWYEKDIFGIYTFSYVDGKGDNVYLRKGVKERFLYRDTRIGWSVSNSKL